MERIYELFVDSYFDVLHKLTVDNVVLINLDAVCRIRLIFFELS